MRDNGLTAQLAKVCSLGDRTRRQLYDFVVDQPHPVSRDVVSNALDIERSLAAYHLDKLVDHGLLVATFARPDGRGGPGAGRPTKHYSRSDIELEISVPARDYRLVAEVLATAIDADPGGAVHAAVDAAAEALGRDVGAAESGSVDSVLQRYGYEPFADGAMVRLRNCPFHRVASEHVQLICGMNLALMRGILEGLGAGDVDVLLDPGPDRCCVALTGDA